MLLILGLLSTIGFVAFILHQQHQALQARVDELVNAHRHAASRINELEQRVKKGATARQDAGVGGDFEN